MASVVHGVGHAHVGGPVPERGHGHVCAHAHDRDHVDGTGPLNRDTP